MLVLPVDTTSLGLAFCTRSRLTLRAPRFVHHVTQGSTEGGCELGPAWTTEERSKMSTYELTRKDRVRSTILFKKQEDKTDRPQTALEKCPPVDAEP